MSHKLERDLLSEYFVSITSVGEPPEWRWEIKRRSKPLGIKLYANGFKSENAAKLAVKKLRKSFSMASTKSGAKERKRDQYRLEYCAPMNES